MDEPLRRARGPKILKKGLCDFIKTITMQLSKILDVPSDFLTKNFTEEKDQLYKKYYELQQLVEENFYMT